jgi:G3E family GTPase
MSRVPFTILTGWLGAGKTTALNRMLAASHGKRIAVLVNELGRISIDTQLIVGRGSDVLELAGGCVCCEVDLKNDLWDGVADIVARSNPDHVVLETTGIAEPATILEALVSHKGLPGASAAATSVVRERIVGAGVVCVVDAETGGDALHRQDSAREQVMTADRILVAKLDVAPRDRVLACHALLDELAPHAERASFPADDAGATAMTAWVLERRPLRLLGEPAHAEHVHRNQLVATVFADDAPLVGERVLAVIESLGDRLVRAKGFVHLAGDDRRGFVERAGVRTSLEIRDAWGDAPRRSEIVLIGEDLDEGAIRRALWACRAAV